MSLFEIPPQSICILRLSAIGDVCNALAIVQAIQKHWQHTQITWIIGKTERQLLQNVQGIHFVEYDKKAGLKGILAVWRQLREHKFDALLNMQTALRASILSLGVKAKYKIGFGKIRSREMQHWFVNRRIQDPLNPHVLYGFMAFAEYLGVPVSEPSWTFEIPSELTQKMRQYIGLNRETLIIAPCSSKAEKEWDVVNYAKIANLAYANHKQVIFCASKAAREQALCQEILMHCDFEPINLVGKTSLLELAALIQQADLVLSPDSATAHIANAVGTAVIGLYAYHNPKRTAPFLHLDKVISVYEQGLDTECQNISNLPWAYKRKTPHLMTMISIQQVVDKMRELRFLV